MANNFRYISFKEIVDCGITPEECIEWTEYVIKNKNECVLHAKDSIKFGNECFFNTMPSYIPEKNIFGVKEVSRITGREPALQADLLLYNSFSGNLICAMDATWITTMRTGAVAAVTANALEKRNNNTYSFVGLGNTARATLLCLDAIKKHSNMNVRLLKYKDQAELFIERFKSFKNISFSIIDTPEEFYKEGEVIISCITAATSLLAKEEWFQKGVLLIPVHTRGFQNCDLAFDNIFCDDIPHISGFKSFSEYKNVTEMTDVLNDTSSTLGRKNDDERLIAYNIGISLEDVYYAAKIAEKMGVTGDVSINENIPKFWA